MHWIQTEPCIWNTFVWYGLSFANAVIILLDIQRTSLIDWNIVCPEPYIFPLFPQLLSRTKDVLKSNCFNCPIYSHINVAHMHLLTTVITRVKERGRIILMDGTKSTVQSLVMDGLVQESHGVLSGSWKNRSVSESLEEMWKRQCMRVSGGRKWVLETEVSLEARDSNSREVDQDCGRWFLYPIPDAVFL